MHLDVSELPMVGGHPALDLVNTVTPRAPLPGGERHDHLLHPAALLVWGCRAGLLDEAAAKTVASAWRADPGAGQAALRAVRGVREALHATLLAATGFEPPESTATGAALKRLHARWAAAAGRATLVLDPEGGPAVRLVVGKATAHLVPDRVAESTMDLLRGGELGRLRRCPPDEGGCGWFVLDRSRNGSRRWCRMEDCGTEVKARRLTQRRRVARGAAR